MLHKHNIKILRKDDKVTVQIFMLYFFTARLNEAYIGNVSFTKCARKFIWCPEFYFFFKNI